MAKEEAHAATPTGGAAQPSGPSKGPLLLALVNTVVILATAGLLYYTKIIFKHPVITETKERARLAAERAKKTKEKTDPGLVKFEQITVNIESTPAAPKPAENSSRPINGKLHYATISFALELSDISHQDRLEDLRPKILDQVISMLGRKTFAELTTVQGRYLVKTQIMDTANHLLQPPKKPAAPGAPPEASKDEAPVALVTNCFFSQFIVQ